MSRISSTGQSGALLPVHREIVFCQQAFELGKIGNLRPDVVAALIKGAHYRFLWSFDM
jgi:hypothetical protein